MPSKESELSKSIAYWQKEIATSRPMMGLTLQEALEYRQERLATRQKHLQEYLNKSPAEKAKIEAKFRQDQEEEAETEAEARAEEGEDGGSEVLRRVPMTDKEKFNPLDPLGLLTGDTPSWPDPLGVFKGSKELVGTVARGGQSLTPLYDGLKMAIPDELKAVGEYRAMAQLARNLADAIAPGEVHNRYARWATELDGIADQEA